MPEKLAARVAVHADAGGLALERAMEAALAAHRLYEAAAEKQRETVTHLRDAASALHAVRAAAQVPPLPPEPAPAQPRRLPDSTRLIPALTLALVAAGVAACYPRGTTVSQVTFDRPHQDRGLAALRAGDLDAAAHEFMKAGDDVRLAEVRVLQGRPDGAAELLAGREDGQAKFLLGLVAHDRGDADEAKRLFVQARNLGCATAQAALNAYYPGA